VEGTILKELLGEKKSGKGSEEKEDVHQFHWAGRSCSKYKAAEEKLSWVKLCSAYEVDSKQRKKAGV